MAVPKGWLACGVRRVDVLLWASSQLGGAVRRGEVSKPDLCEECGGRQRLTAHHDDYREPLTVRWLCYSCHAKWHRKHGPGKGIAEAALRMPPKLSREIRAVHRHVFGRSISRVEHQAMRITA